MKVTRAVDENLSIDNEIEFTVDNFVNPFNSIEKTGFQVTTMENTGTGKMDESEILSITVTEFASMESPSVTRGDFMTTVGEFSSLTFSFQLNLPVDPDCRIRVIFPTDQPLTADLTSSKGTNLFSSAFGLSAFNLEEGYVEIAGCPSYSDRTVAQQPSSVTLSKILNIGWIKDTLPFKFQLFAVQSGTNFRIAEVQTSTMIVKASTMLSRGKILQLKIAALESQLAGTDTLFGVTIRPVHRMPSNSKIKVTFPLGKNQITLQAATTSTCSVIAEDTTLIDPSLA